MLANRKNPGDEVPEGDKLLPNSAVDDFFVKMNRQVRRPRPSEEAVAAALQAIQRLAGEVATGEGHEITEEPLLVEGEQCPKCGGVNAVSNRFCGYCGALVDRTQTAAAKTATSNNALAPTPATPGQHIYHHHYHHHYFPANGTHAAETLSAVANEPTSPGVPPVDSAAAERALRQLVQDWTSQSHAKSVDALAGLYCVDGILVRPDATVLRSRASIRQYLEATITAGLTDVQLDLTDIRLLGPLACLAGVSRILVPVSRGQQERTGKFLMLARYESGNWKILADIWCMNRDPLPSGNDSLAQEPEPIPAPAPTPTPAPTQRNRHRYTW